MAESPPPVRPHQCRTCVFRPDAHLWLRPGRLAEIQRNVIRGVNQLCHSERGPSGAQARIVCRGGRDFALTIWHRLGIIAEPTDAALAVAAEAAGEGAGHA